jgi:hypothetical protein
MKIAAANRIVDCKNHHSDRASTVVSEMQVKAEGAQLASVAEV